MKLRWKTFEHKMKTKELPQDKLEKFFGIKPTVIEYHQYKLPVLQVSHDDVTWHDVPYLPPIPPEEQSDENT